MIAIGGRCALLAAGVACASASIAQASITVYSGNRAAWEAGVGGSFVEETFTGSAYTQSIATFSLQGVGHTSPFLTFAGITNDRFEDRLDNVAGESTTWSFSQAVTGFGANWDLTPDGAGTGIDIAIQLFSGGSLVGAGSIPNSFAGEFWGFTSTELFDKVVLTFGGQPGNAETYYMDNMVFSPIPLPAAAWIGLAGMGCVAAGHRRWRR